MPEQNLNPDALEAAAKQIATRNGFTFGEIAENAIRAYLSALPAQPELPENSKPNQNLEFDTVNSVEELDALPVGTIIEDSEPCVLRLSPDSELWFVPGSTQGWVSEVIELPATVLYRPVEG